MTLNDTTKAPMDSNTLLPAVFVLASLSKGLYHLGTKNRKPLCGKNLCLPALSDTEIFYKDDELYEKWFDVLSKEKSPVKVMEFEYCKQCLKTLKKWQVTFCGFAMAAKE